MCVAFSHKSWMTIISNSDLLPWITCYLHYLHANYVLAETGGERGLKFRGLLRREKKGPLEVANIQLQLELH